MDEMNVEKEWIEIYGRGKLENPRRKHYPDLVQFTMKPTCSDRDMNSGPQRNGGSLGGSPGELSEELMTQEKRKKGWIMNCDVGEVIEGLENEL